LHSHLVWLRLSISSIVEMPSRLLGGSRWGVSSMDPCICQTSTASPAEPGAPGCTRLRLEAAPGSLRVPA
jgi:hypothetical protein